jgi:hypothetical protein
MGSSTRKYDAGHYCKWLRIASTPFGLSFHIDRIKLKNYTHQAPPTLHSVSLQDDLDLRLQSKLRHCDSSRIVSVMRNILSCLIAVILAMPSSASAQSVGNNGWAAVATSPAGQNLQVELKSGKTVKGKLSSASESGLTLLRGKTKENIERADVRRIYRKGGKSVGKSTLIGAGVGGAGGAIVGTAAGGDGKGIMSFSRKGGAAVFGVAGAAIGAITGLVIGLVRHKKTLIYEA